MGRCSEVRGFLFSNAKYCCLGVLCEINHEELGIVKESVHEGLLYNGETTMPTSDLQREFFGRVSIPMVEIDGKFKYLHVHNDLGKTFEQIADAIEAQL